MNLIFGVKNIRSRNKRYLQKQIRKVVIIYSDVSDIASGAYTVEVNEKIYHQMWSEGECTMSSTWREMKAIEQALISFQSFLKDVDIKWFTDNQNCVKILKCGSMKPHLQVIAFNIFSVCVKNGIIMDIQWIPRIYERKS